MGFSKAALNTRFIMFDQIIPIRAVAEPRLGLEGPGLTLGSQYINLKLELAQPKLEGLD
jgi:hypothetical protein